MSIIIPKNQPVVFNYPQSDCDACDPRTYCTPIMHTDETCFQLSQQPCGPNLICDGGFTYLSSNLVTDGDFVTDPTLSGWTLGAGWAWAGGQVTVTASTNQLKFAMAGLITYDRQYIVRFTLTRVDVGSSNINVTLGGGSVASGITTGGTYTYIALNSNANTDLIFSDGTGTTTSRIDNVEVYDIGPCWTYNHTWDLSNPGFSIHVSGTTNLTQATPPLTSGVYYKVKFTLSGVSSGYVQAQLGTVLGDIADGDGDYIQYITANNTGFAFKPSTTSAFIGSISNVDIRPLINDFTFEIQDNYTDEVLNVVTNGAYYFNEFITNCFKPSTLPITFGLCIKAHFTDQCQEVNDNILPDPGFIGGIEPPSWYNDGSWVAGYRSAVVLALTGGVLRYYFDGKTSEVLADPGWTYTKYRYHIRVWGSVSNTAPVGLFIGGRLLKAITTPGTYEGITTVTLPLLSNAVRVVANGDGVSPVTSKTYVSDVYVYPVIEVDESYDSNCMFIINEPGCTRELKAYNDTNGNGFNFTDTGFTLSHRILVNSVNPFYPSQGSEYLFSNGIRAIITSQREKFWTLNTEFIPEWVHDCVSFQILCHHFFLDDVEYFVKIEDYTPKYLSGNNYVRLAASSMEIRLKDDTLFVKNCS